MANKTGKTAKTAESGQGDGAAILVKLDFEKLRSLAAVKEDVMPVAVQDADTGEVLMIAFANRLALEESLRRRIAVFWSTSRNELWIKGETSGDYLALEEVRVNCYANSLLFRVKLKTGAMCHTKDADGKTRYGCFYRELTGPGEARMVNQPPYSGR